MTYLHKHEIDAMLGVPDQVRPQGRHDRALQLFLYNTGARVSEAAGVAVADRPPTSPPCASTARDAPSAPAALAPHRNRVA